MAGNPEFLDTSGQEIEYETDKKKRLALRDLNPRSIVWFRMKTWQSETFGFNDFLIEVAGRNEGSILGTIYYCDYPPADGRTMNIRLATLTKDGLVVRSDPSKSMEISIPDGRYLEIGYFIGHAIEAGFPEPFMAQELELSSA
jgi:RimJ/RimL family protein N-acetyltransferase